MSDGLIKPIVCVTKPLGQLSVRTISEASSEFGGADLDLARVDDNAPNRSVIDNFASQTIKRHLIVWGKAIEI